MVTLIHTHLIFVEGEVQRGQRIFGSCRAGIKFQFMGAICGRNKEAMISGQIVKNWLENLDSKGSWKTQAKHQSSSLLNPAGSSARSKEWVPYNIFSLLYKRGKENKTIFLPADTRGTQALGRIYRLRLT